MIQPIFVGRLNRVHTSIRQNQPVQRSGKQPVQNGSSTPRAVNSKKWQISPDVIRTASWKQFKTTNSSLLPMASRIRLVAFILDRQNANLFDSKTSQHSIDDACRQLLHYLTTGVVTAVNRGCFSLSDLRCSHWSHSI